MINERSIMIPLALVEGVHLAHLVEEFTGILTGSELASDPAIDRLTPDAYPEDVEASAGFAHATRGDLLDRRSADAAVVRHGLEPFLSTATKELVVDEGAAVDTEVRDLVIDTNNLDAWLRTITALRLVIATRLDITSNDDDHDPEDPRFGIYDWLGYRLENLIAIADAHDNVID